MTGSMNAGLSARLAEFATQTVQVPGLVRQEAARSIMNGLATGLAGSHDKATLISMQTARRFAASDEAGIIGHAERFDLLNAAFLNAIAINVFDFDDTHPGTILHPTAPVLPPLLALAETLPISGPALLDAFAIGVEVECRIANAVSPEHYRRGWHITATCGVFGAAAAAGRILGLDAGQMLNALGIASAQAGGLVETLGSMAKSVGVGNAARGGLIAALLAKEGMTGPALPLEGPRAFITVTSENPDFAKLSAGLGETWELRRNTYKPYPCGVVLNPVIEAALDLSTVTGFDAKQVQQVVVRGHPLLAERADRPDPIGGREAQVSAQHAVAVSLRCGKAGLDEFSDAAVADASNIALRNRVTVEVDATIPVGAAVLEVTLLDGSTLNRRVDQARGDSDLPLTDAAIEKKMRELAAWGAPSVAVDPLIRAVWALPEDPGPVNLSRLAAPR